MEWTPTKKMSQIRSTTLSWFWFFREREVTLTSEGAVPKVELFNWELNWGNLGAEMLVWIGFILKMSNASGKKQQQKTQALNLHNSKRLCISIILFSVELQKWPTWSFLDNIQQINTDVMTNIFQILVNFIYLQKMHQHLKWNTHKSTLSTI